MKTHALAQALRTLSNVLEKAPNMDIQEISFFEKVQTPVDKKEVAVNLQTLFALSKINKKQWADLIADYGFSIAFNQRDSSRNILGKLLTYLENHPEAVEILKEKSRDPRKPRSNLLEALDVLLGE